MSTPPGSSDYVYQNALATKLASVSAKERRHTSGEDEGKKWLTKQDFGQVPSYLQARKLQLAEQLEQAEVDFSRLSFPTLYGSKCK